MSLLGKLGRPNVEKLKARGDIKGLIKALSSKDKDIPRDASKSLVEIGTPAVEPLIGALEDKNDDVRRSAAYALGCIGDHRALEPLVAILDAEPRGGRMISTCVDALGKLGDVRATKSLIAALSTEDEFHSAGGLSISSHWPGAREALIQVGAPAVEPLIAALGDERYAVSGGARSALTTIGAPAVEPLVATLSDSSNCSNQVRAAAAEALGEIADERAVEPLVATLMDENSEVRQRTVYALGKIGDERAVEPLVAVLNGSDKDVRLAVLCALGEIGDERAVEPLVATLMDENSEVRQRAADVLGVTGSPLAVEPLRAALKDSDQDVSRMAARALNRLDSRATSSEDRDLQMIVVLEDLCDAYAANWGFERLEPAAKEVGKELNEQGGLAEMRRVFSKLGGRRGSRTLEMHWGGIGDWQG